MTRLREGSLFTGTNALGIAARTVLDTAPVWFCDNDKAATRLLAHHYPHVPNLGDITATDWNSVEPVDVLTGGFPCQDISSAGTRLGIGGQRSGLWSYFADAIRLLRPRYVLVENVGALAIRGLDRVLADLAALGLDAEWTTVRASDVGAPHRRERLFLVAADTAHHGHQRTWTARSGRAGPPNHGVATAHATRDGRHERRTKPARQRGGSHAAERGTAPTDTDRHGRERRSQRHGEPFDPQPPRRCDAHRRLLDWGPYEPAVHHWQHVLGRPAPEPTVMGTRGRRILNPALPEWMMGLPNGWITTVPGLTRAQQLRLAGNGVVPLQAIAALEHLLPLLTDRGDA